MPIGVPALARLTRTGASCRLRTSSLTKPTATASRAALSARASWNSAVYAGSGWYSTGSIS